MAAALALGAAQIAQAQDRVLPAHTDVPVTLDQDLSSAGARVGQRFGVTVSRDIVADGRIVIPRGTPGTGEIALRTGKGAYGRSGKLEIALRALDLDGRSIPVTGRFRADGKGATAATIGAVAFGGLVAGVFVKGQHARFAAGQEFHAFTTDRVAMQGDVRRVAAMQRVAVTPAALMPVIATPARAVDTVYIAQATPPAGSYQTLLAAQQGVRGRSAQGWTISD
ncbi:hypothetical protein DM480_00125 [Sphingomonas sp. FARSPH]|nr:hypothetical protein DM480_00125 [Sphingomonas sp. FARSPH]